MAVAVRYNTTQNRGLVMLTIKVEVTQDNIDKGKQCHASDCPVALAMLQAGLQGPACDPWSLLFIYEGVAYVAETPLSVKYFIKGFDTGQPSKPFSFELCKVHRR